MRLSVIESLKEEINMLKSSHSVTQPTPATHASHSSESKFNIVLLDVQECPSGMSRSAGFESYLLVFFPLLIVPCSLSQ